ncbi:hypothetical protein CVT91_09655 [Candidatus Atribacteria bacterium HGW-Atribacteria-1]|nr:MAG: hypothetical protein CVT91_09655 [Candidatus Atribacteria bacterium HGW-Atribacteria-1]
MKKIFCLILIFIIVNFCVFSISLADGGLFVSLYRDIYEPNQLAMIVFDDMVEKIIFQVDYEGDAEDFAWVIPVPGYPKLFPVEDEIFYELHELTKPVPPWSFGCAWGMLPTAPGDEGVHIWEENQVGIYHTTTLSASDPNSLVEWLNDNGYAFPIEGQEILDYYVQKNWFFVAMKIQSGEIVNNSEYYTGAIQPIGIMFFSDEMIYPLKISAVSVPLGGTEVLIYAFSDNRVTFPGAKEEYNKIVTPDELKEYPILQSLIDETFVLTKLRETFTKSEMEDDLVLVPVPKYLALGNVINLNSPVGQFILIMGIFVFLLKIKNRVLKS